MSIDAPNNNSTQTRSSSSKPSSNRPEAQSAAPSDKPATSLDSINIKVGQAVRAKVLETLNIATARATQNQFNVTLEIGGEKLAVKTNILLQPGQIVNLNVNNKGELILPKPANNDAATLISALSKVLPYQQPVGKVLTTLLQNLPTLGAENSQVARLTEQLTALLPKAASFSTNISNNQQSNPAQLVKQAMSQSGIFMESTFASAGKQQTLSQASSTSLSGSLLSNATIALAQAIKSATSTSTTSASSTTTNSANALLTTTGMATPTDLKSTISQLINSLNSIYAAKHSATGQIPRFMAEADPNLLVNPFNFPSPLSATKSTSQYDKNLSVGDLLKRLAGALNRIQFQQLNSLYQAQTASTDTTSVQTWQMELPFLTSQNQIDSVQLRIDEEKDNNDNDADTEKKSKWKLALTFDLEGLGPIFIQVNLSPPTVSTTIWAEEQKTLKLINQETHNLRDSFSELGLTVEDITCRQGQPNMRKTRIDQQIVDIKA
ncbi:flagellar hook-length control protein FliK [Alkalimarinus alittae]|uniref:Flagellar hook-length control protein FliK n=1 Tax=Alkalimarinus alittae TaxID=2961619 RepID=A0ABY6MYL9_9ALTE|nr:flagellar hook-length control protein FliK [Alkalimarinus alittae]UZE94926.1 flagellar hook-length control protein FliK [Alkalimarinus alittae]